MNEMNQAQETAVIHSAQSPYGVPVKAVQEQLNLTIEPLAPFEERALKYLINQYNAAPDRIRAEFLKHIQN